jgi:hypothetical protein
MKFQLQNWIKLNKKVSKYSQNVRDKNFHVRENKIGGLKQTIKNKIAIIFWSNRNQIKF